MTQIHHLPVDIVACILLEFIFVDDRVANIYCLRQVCRDWKHMIESTDSIVLTCPDEDPWCHDALWSIVSMNVPTFLQYRREIYAYLMQRRNACTEWEDYRGYLVIRAIDHARWSFYQKLRERLFLERPYDEDLHHPFPGRLFRYTL